MKRARPDAVVLDIEMPGLSGYSVARELREIFGEAAPFLIAISGRRVGESDRMLAELAGFDHFLRKRCDPRLLLDLLEPLRALPPLLAPEPTIG